MTAIKEEKEDEVTVITLEQLRKIIKEGFNEGLFKVKEDIEKIMEKRFENTEKVLSEQVNQSVESTNSQLMQMEQDFKEIIRKHIEEDISSSINDKLAEIENNLMSELNDQVANLKESIFKEVKK